MSSPCRLLRRWCVVLLLVAATGCSSAWVRVAPEPVGTVKRLANVEGTGCGSLFLLFPFTDVFPMGLNSRVQSAYDEALEEAEGATAVVDVSIEESWFWWILGTTRCVTVRGVAVK